MKNKFFPAIARAFRFTATGAQLLLMLACACVAEHGPTAGRHLGRWAGRTIRTGMEARAIYDTRYAATVEAIAVCCLYWLRAFVAAQLGTHCPKLTTTIAPSTFCGYTLADLNIRELKAIASVAGIHRYSWLTKAQLVEALATA